LIFGEASRKSSCASEERVEGSRSSRLSLPAKQAENHPARAKSQSKDLVSCRLSLPAKQPENHPARAKSESTDSVSSTSFSIQWPVLCRSRMFGLRLGLEPLARRIMIVDFRPSRASTSCSSGISTSERRPPPVNPRPVVRLPNAIAADAFVIPSEPERQRRRQGIGA
jgi:hypothetical protein